VLLDNAADRTVLLSSLDSSLQGTIV